MQIYVVKSGDELNTIANTYGATTTALIDANELDTPNDLVVGQALVIPIIGQFYFVQPGDSLYSIAQKFSKSYQQLAQINQIPIDNILSVGLRLYIPPQPKREITSNAYIEPHGQTVSQPLINATTNNTPFLTYLSPFSYTVNDDGTLNPPPLDKFKQTAATNNTALMLAVTNLRDGQFSTELGRIILTNQTVQNQLLDTIIQTANTVGYSDVHFDLEFLPPENREDYNAFLRKARDRLHAKNLTLSTALAPKTSTTQKGILYEAHDYAAHGEIADMVVLMTYEWGYSGGPPLAVSPINDVREVVNFALSVMPADKILLGQDLYGYDWTLPFEQGGKPAQAVSPQRAIAIAREQNVQIKYDQQAQAPFFHYTGAQGNLHEVWFEDARSIQAKFDMIIELGLLGISYWKLGLAFPQNWLLLRNNFTIRKVTGTSS